MKGTNFEFKFILYYQFVMEFSTVLIYESSTNETVDVHKFVIGIGSVRTSF